MNISRRTERADEQARSRTPQPVYIPDCGTDEDAYAAAWRDSLEPQVQVETKGRPSKLKDAIHEVMHDGRWRTLDDVAVRLGYEISKNKVSKMTAADRAHHKSKRQSLVGTLRAMQVKGDLEAETIGRDTSWRRV